MTHKHIALPPASLHLFLSHKSSVFSRNSLLYNRQYPLLIREIFHQTISTHNQPQAPHNGLRPSRPRRHQNQHLRPTTSSTTTLVGATPLPHPQLHQRQPRHNRPLDRNSPNLSLPVHGVDARLSCTRIWGAWSCCW